MISKIVGNIFYVIFITIIMLGLVGAIIASGIWLETSGELIIIALIVAFVIGFAVLLVLVVMTISKEVITKDTIPIIKVCQSIMSPLRGDNFGKQCLPFVYLPTNFYKFQ